MSPADVVSRGVAVRHAAAGREPRGDAAVPRAAVARRRQAPARRRHAETRHRD